MYFTVDEGGPRVSVGIKEASGPQLVGGTALDPVQQRRSEGSPLDLIR